MQPTPRWVFKVNLALSTLSVCGGLAILVGWLLAPTAQKRSLRPLLILGLGLTDVLQGAVVLAGNASELRGDPFEMNSSGCLASSFLYQTSIISVATWTLFIALTTYITLCHPFSRAAALLEHRFAFPIITLCVIAVGVIPSIPVTIIYDMVDAGGVCWLRKGVQGALLLFIPRAAVLVLTILLYLRLFIFFRTRDTKLLDTTEDDDGDRRMSKRLSLASIRLARWSTRRSSEGTRVSPAALHGNLSPGPPPLSPIPGSPATPAIAFSAPFGSPPHSPIIAHHSVSVSLPPSHESPTQSVDSTPTPDDYGSPTTPAAPQPKRNSSVAFPPHLSVAGDHSPTGEPKASHISMREKGIRAKKPLSPRQINKRLSLLMTLYPAAYVALVAVACARLIQSLSRGGALADPGLRYASAFLIYSQGAIDGILFVVVAVAFRRWSRRD